MVGLPRNTHRAGELRPAPEEEGDAEGGLVFGFPLCEPEGLGDLEHHLLADPEGPPEEPAYGAVRLAYDPRLARDSASWLRRSPELSHLCSLRLSHANLAQNQPLTSL